MRVILQFISFAFILVPVAVSASTLYVNVSSISPKPPYTNWATAASVIQDAVDVASSGDTILVTNGVYQVGGKIVFGALTNRVAATLPITIQSINGPDVTIINGNPSIGDAATRCVYLTNGCSLLGFTLANGATRGADAALVQERQGGGLFCESTSAVVSNCIFTGNSAQLFGGASRSGTLISCQLRENTAYEGGAASLSILINSLVNSNTASLLGGGCYNATLTNCIVSSNRCTGTLGGGGVYECYAFGCTLINNSALNGGGAGSGQLDNCVIVSNTAVMDGGGTLDVVVNNSIIRDNSAYWGGGARSGTLNNSTVLRNSGSAAGGTYNSWGNNSIVYFNMPSDAVFQYNTGPYFFRCCAPEIAPGAYNFTNAPRFVNEALNDFHLASNSPCINSGDNAYVNSSFDFEKNARISGGIVDVGAYEFQSPSSHLPYIWLEQYGLVPDGSIDSADADSDEMNNYQEWVAGTDPTNALSVLKMLALSRTNANGAILVKWQSAPYKHYSVQRSVDLATQVGFITLQTNIFGGAGVGVTTYVDNTATNTGPYFYRVSVQ